MKFSYLKGSDRERWRDRKRSSNHWFTPKWPSGWVWASTPSWVAHGWQGLKHWGYLLLMPSRDISESWAGSGVAEMETSAHRRCHHCKWQLNLQATPPALCPYLLKTVTSSINYNIWDFCVLPFIYPSSVTFAIVIALSQFLLLLLQKYMRWGQFIMKPGWAWHNGWNG